VPEQERPSDLSWARGCAVRAAAAPSAESKRASLAGVPEEDGEEQDGPTEADLELRQLLAEWNDEAGEEAPAGGTPARFDPALERGLGVQWLHEHVVQSGIMETPEKPGKPEVRSGPDSSVDLFAGAFRAAAREEAHVREEFEKAPRPTAAAAAAAPPQAGAHAVTPGQEAPAAPQPPGAGEAAPGQCEQQDVSMRQVYILPAEAPGAKAEPHQLKAEEPNGKRPETDFLKLMTAWSDEAGPRFKDEPGQRPLAKAAGRALAAPGDGLAREMREATQASPALAKLRVQLAEDKIVQPPPEYRSFCQRLKSKQGNLRKFIADLRSLPVASVTDVPRAKSASDPLKAPVVVEARRGWRPKAFTQAFWNYESGETLHRCFHRYPPCAADEKRATGSLEVRIDEFATYTNVLKDSDAECLQERGLAYPRFFIGGWCPFRDTETGRALWMEDWKSGRQLWAPPGVKDISHRWVKMFCAGGGLDWERALASFDRVQIGPAGMVTRLHVENNSAHAWYGQVQGRRAFILFAPQERERLYPETAWPERCSEERCEHSPVDVLHPNERLYPKFRESKAQVAVLQPGETLVIPQGWWHCSIVLEPCVTLARRFWNRVNRSSIHEEFVNFVREEDMECGMRDVFFNHIEGCRRNIAQDDSSDEDDDPRM